MSTVKLTLFASYTKNKSGPEGKVGILFGASESHLMENGHFGLLFSGVPIAKELPPPASPSEGLLMLYGLRDSTEELQRRRTQARNEGANFQFAELEVEVGEIAVGIIDAELIKKCRFANVKRMSAALQQEIVDTFAEYIEQEGGKPEVEMNRIKSMALRPDLFGRLISEHKLFKKIEVLIIPIEERGVIRQVAYVRPNCKYVSLSQNTDDEILFLPPKFGKQVLIEENAA